MTVFSSAVFAGETQTSEDAEEITTEAAEETKEISGGLLQAIFGSDGLLFGEDGPLHDSVPEGTDLDEMVSTVQEQIGEADSEIGMVLSELDSKFEEYGEFSSEEGLGMFLGELLGQYMGGGSDLEAIMEISESIKDAQKQYILDHNADVLEPGDVQIVSNGSIYMDEFTPEDTQIINFADMIQTNYRLDEENHLLLIGEAEDVVLFTHQKDEEGNYPVVEAVFAEDGEAYTSSLEEMCVKAGISLDECLESITFAEAIAPIDLQHYMQEHPEITGIEYQGEIRTEEELGDIWLDAVMALYPEEGLTEGESEEAMTE